MTLICFKATQIVHLANSLTLYKYLHSCDLADIPPIIQKVSSGLKRVGDVLNVLVSDPVDPGHWTLVHLIESSVQR